MKRLSWFTIVVLVIPSAADAAGGTTCTAVPTTVAFGTYVTTATSPTDTTGSIAVTCNPNTTTQVEVSFDAGVNGGGNVNNRNMANGSNLLGYQLYSDSGRTTVWGSGSNGTNDVKFNSPGSVTVFGRIPAKQAVPFGPYTDTITLTLKF